jgi:hypothetical protein
MQYLRWHFLVASLIALPLNVNATWAGTHDRDLAFDDLKRQRDYGPESIEDKIKGQKDYQSIVKSLEQNLTENENVLCNFNVDKKGRIKNLQIISEKPPTDLEKKVLALISKAAPFPNLPSAEMISKGGQIEFWQWHGINLAARVAPPLKPAKAGYSGVDPFKDLAKSSSY